MYNTTIPERRAYSLRMCVSDSLIHKVTHSFGPRQGLEQVKVTAADNDTNRPNNPEFLECLAPDGRERSGATRFDDELQAFPHKSHRSANFLGAAKARKTISKADGATPRKPFSLRQTQR